MKKQIILLTLLTISICITAQNKNTNTPEKSNIKWLFKAGIMSTSMSSVNLNSKIGYQFGVTGDFSLSEDTYLNTGFVYQAKGFSNPGREVLLSYLEIPATWMSKVNRVWLGAGLYAGIPLRTETSFKNADIGARALIALPFGQEQKTAISLEFTYGITSVVPSASIRHSGIGLNLLQYF